MIPADANPLLLSPTQYRVSRSLRFNSADSAYLSRTPGSASNRKTFTFSCWAKRGTLGSEQVIFAARTGATSPWFRLLFRGAVSVNSLHVQGDTNLSLITSAFFRDTTSWLHIVVAVDTTQATSSNRVKLYINGTQLTSFVTATYPVQNADLAVNSTAAHNIGVELTNSIYFNGYLADIHFIDGQALTPSSFAYTDDNGEWQPRFYGGTYGTNGFKLNFADNSGTTSATLGKDVAGSNDWTPNNFSVTADTGNDSLTDTPTSFEFDSGIGGEVRGNYATLNPLSTVTTVTPANGNLDYSSATTGQNAIATIGVSTGKWYWEVVTTAGTTQTRVGVYSTAASSLYSLAVNNTVYGIRFDADAGTLDYTSDGTNWTSIATGLTSGPYFPYFNNNGTTAKTVSVNFGQRPFAYTAPSGYKTLCDTNLTAGTVTTSGSFTGNANGNGPFVWLNGVPTAMTINSNAVTFGTHADKLSNGFKLRTSSTSYNASGSNTYSVTTTGNVFVYARAQTNP